MCPPIGLMDPDRVSTSMESRAHQGCQGKFVSLGRFPVLFWHCPFRFWKLGSYSSLFLNHKRGDPHPRFCTLSQGHSLQTDGAMVSKDRSALLISYQFISSIVCNKPSFRNLPVHLRRTESVLKLLMEGLLLPTYCLEQSHHDSCGPILLEKGV